jgi:hypothetical protein
VRSYPHILREGAADRPGLRPPLKYVEVPATVPDGGSDRVSRRAWRVGVTVALITWACLALSQRRLTAATPGKATARTRHLLSRLPRDQYACLHARVVPETGQVIDYLIIGPPGFTP